MHSCFIVLLIFLFSSHVGSYVPLFVAQKYLNKSPEKLIVQINHVTNKALPENNKEIFNFYRIMLDAEVKFTGETKSMLHEGNMINIFYETSEIKPNLRPLLLGYMPINIPNEQDLCIVYLKNNKANNYKLNTHWALQVIDEEVIKNILSDDQLNPKLEQTPQWVKEGIKKLQNISITD